MEVDGGSVVPAAVAEEEANGAKPLTPEEEALRRSTDCVYFLASPFTCKKGKECDFRHSEGARMNLRDCWYWLNGNCLNPKCAFRHPPIDGMFGAPTPAIPVASSHYASYSLGKQMVPCYYFQKGNCIKGDKCPFYHGPQPTGNNPSEQVTKVSSFPMEQPQTQKNDLLGMNESAQTNHLIQQGGQIIDDRSKITFNRSTNSSAKTAAVELASNAMQPLPHNSMPVVERSCRTSSGEDHPDCYQNHLNLESDPTKDWNPNYQTPLDDGLSQNSRDADELFGESSPGFDVLVDNAADGAAYLHDEEYFDRDVYPAEDNEYARADFEIGLHNERESFNGMVEQGQMGQIYKGYERKRRRTSSERNMDRPFHSERSRHRETGPIEIDGSDLRHRLCRRKVNGSSSGISPEHNGQRRRRDDHCRERTYNNHHSHRDRHDRHQGPRGSTLSSRLQGRIELPGRSPDKVDACSEKGRDTRQLRGRLSPVRHMDIEGGRHREAGKHQERTRQRSSELASSAKNVDIQHSRRNVVDSLNLPIRKNFATDSRKANGAGFEASHDFEGPKPLSLILQRKREAEWGNASSAHNANEDKSTEVSHRQTGSLVGVEKEGFDNNISSEDCKSRSVDEEYKERGHISVEGHKQSLFHNDKPEVEDIIKVDPVENQEADNCDLREGESDYEAVDGLEYKSEDENANRDDEEFDDDDDDFARKVGVVFS